MNQAQAPSDTGERSTARLYRATLGEAAAERYLPVFARFDDQGLAGPVWSSAAAFFHLGWLLHHRLWLALSGCLVLATGVVLLVRRFTTERVRQVTNFADFFALLLVLSIILTGDLMRFGAHFDLAQTRLWAASLLTLQPAMAAMSARRSPAGPMQAT